MLSVGKLSSWWLHFVRFRFKAKSNIWNLLPGVTECSMWDLSVWGNKKALWVLVVKYCKSSHPAVTGFGECKALYPFLAQRWPSVASDCTVWESHAVVEWIFWTREAKSDELRTLCNSYALDDPLAQSLSELCSTMQDVMLHSFCKLLG